MESKRIDRLYKSSDDRFLTGVAAGLGDFFNTDPSLMRVLFILLTLANGIGILIYVVLALVLPTQNRVLEEDDELFFETIIAGKKNISEKKETGLTVFDDLLVRENIFALLLIFIGIIILQIDIVPWSLIPSQAQIPILIVIIGLAFIVRSANSKR